jgi:hypothetical protein
VSDYAEELKQNYIELSKSTGESFESIAKRVESHGDKSTAAVLRGLAAGRSGAAAPETAVPAGRAAGNGSLRTAAADADADAAAAAAAAEAERAAAAAAAEAERAAAAEAEKTAKAAKAPAAKKD